ncbi:spaetzle domain-containing protein [Phthorimaea operculella]|nr:spaetzle domain-containing protein [Phthorimaea operculella]
MGWISRCLLFVTLTSTTGYNYRENVHPYLGYPHYNRAHVRRIDVEYDPSLAYTNERIQERSAENTRQLPRMNERSISVTSGIQRVQEKERRRVQPWVEVEDLATRSENGSYSYKIVNGPLKYPSISTRNGVDHQAISDSVVFPGQTSAQTFKPDIPNQCEDLGICAEINNYPQDIVDDIISRLDAEKIKRFHVDELEPEIVQRIGPDDNAEIELCNFKELIIVPQAAKGKNGNWYVILNNKNNPLQGYRVEICSAKGQSCADNIASFYSGYTAICKQKYVQRTMAAVDVDRREVLYDMPFKVPSCCSCVALHTGK